MRKAHTISLSKAQGSCHKTSNNQPIHKCGYPFGDSIVTRALLRSLAKAKVMQESVSSRIFVRKKDMNRVQSNGRSLQKSSAKGGKGKIHQ